ncbi:alpha/beta family hydrolase [Dokdonella sp.]|uniref:alpha/beta family hydrolase n=1 Tax=Dokdonella sp. TaxID=2291710 RepID=UPI0025C10294|nr:alpha/beta family hydrolase [Dokdonella sp.]MBX3688393.1 hypothetical protein [Dokdonella sp.]
MKGTVILSHGLESGPQATKVSALAQVCDALGWASVRPDYRDIDALRDPREIDSRVGRLLEHVPTPGRLVFAGSSMGAFISGLASLRTACEGLFLLAVPIEVRGFSLPFDAATVPTTLVHGWRDELCAVEPVIAFARARAATLHLVDDDHRLGAHVQACAQFFGQFLGGLG